MDVVCGIAGLLREFAGRGRLDQSPGKATLETHPFAIHVRTGIAQQLERLGITAELHADVLQDGIGIVLDELEAFLAQQTKSIEVPLDIGRAGRTGTLSRDARGMAASLTSPVLYVDRGEPREPNSQVQYGHCHCTITI
jgi:hypothetical protein